MKTSLALFIHTILFITVGFSQTKAIDSIEIKTDEISNEYTSSDILECQSMQSKLLFKNPEMHSFILGKTIDKRFQTFEYKGKIGSVLYFEFDKDADDSKAFIEGLLWGGKKPNKTHPENVITKEKVMIILSFPFKSQIGKELTEVISGKIN